MVVTNMVQQFSNSMDICKSCIHVYLISAPSLVFTICYIIRGPRFDEFAFYKTTLFVIFLNIFRWRAKFSDMKMTCQKTHVCTDIARKGL